MKIRKTYKIKGMNCESCAKIIEIDLEEAGVENCVCNFPKETLEIRFNPSKINEEKIDQILTKSGYKISPLEK